MQVTESEYGQTKSDWDKKIDLEIGFVICPVSKQVSTHAQWLISGSWRDIAFNPATS